MKKTNYSTNIIEGLVLMISLILLICLAIYLWIFIPYLSDLGTLGDYFGGMVGTFISLITLYYLFKTYQTQKKELKKTSEHLDKQQFESIYFPMLQTFYSIGKDISGFYDNNQYKGDRFFRKFVQLLEDNYTYGSFVINGIPCDFQDLTEFLDQKIDYSNDEDLVSKNLDKKHSINAWALRNNMKYKGLLYEFFYMEFHAATRHYFMYLFNIIKFAITERKDYGDEAKYIKLIQAQMSNDQIILLYFNCGSDLSLDSDDTPTFKEWVIKYGLCDRMDIRIGGIFNSEMNTGKGLFK
jgi:hypothetical protein